VLASLTIVSLLFAAGACSAAEEGWIELFDGKTLTGWVQKNGTAKYTVEDGAVVGRTVEGSPNSFMCTEREFGDFELVFDVKVDNGLNSGVQIRSTTQQHYPPANPNARRQQDPERVNGPQVEIESGGENGAEAGYVYGEATPFKWLVPDDKRVPHKHFKDGEWNTFRVLAQGPRIQTWINGTPIYDLTHEEIYKTHKKGFIALQVHGIKAGVGPFEVRWKNIRIKPLDSQAAGLTDEEKAKGFVALFNGTDFTGWEHAGNWVVEDGVLTRTGKGGSLTYTAAKVPDNFDLRFDWKVGPGSNSGVYYRPTQYEYQILDNAVHADGKNPRTSAASLYFCMAPSRDVTRPVGEWNEARIVCQGTVVQHWLNGEKVIDFDYADPQWMWNVELLNARGGDLAARGANLSLQDHGDPVWYRNIRLREVPVGEDIGHTTVIPATIPDNVLKAEAEKLASIVSRREKQASKPKQ
jgi:hypothetical protein